MLFKFLPDEGTNLQQTKYRTLYMTKKNRLQIMANFDRFDRSTVTSSTI